MTDREPDDFYDALRDRLADYGQEPPAPLWANIWAQLPPPVAAPQLRPRARRRWLSALLLLLLSAGTLGWWWLAGHGPLPTGSGLARQPVLPPAARAVTQTGAQTALSQSAPSSTLDAADAAAPGSSPDANKRAASPSAVNQVLPPSSSAILSGTEVAAAWAGSGRRAGTAALRAVAPAGNKQKARPAKDYAVAKLHFQRSRQRILSSRLLPETAVAAATLPPRAAPPGGTIRPGADAVATRAAADTEISAPVATAPAVAAGLAAASTLSKEAVPTTGTRTAGLGGQQADQTATITPTRTAGAQPPAETLADVTASEASPNIFSRTTTWPLIAARATRLALPSGFLPGTLAWADTLPRLLVPPVRRWAVQALAGPALTSRALGGERLAYMPLLPVYSAPANSLTGRSILSTSSTSDEQAATGFGAELQMQRQFSGRWSLGTGLGYQTFATRQTVQVRVMYSSTAASNLRPDSVGTAPVRNTYRFLTLPLRLGYQLGTGHPRLRYGLRAGADVALYLGGRSTEGSSYGSPSRNWGASGSPYRPLSLALSLGGEVRYRFAPGWEAVAQPTLTHFVTSVARPASGYLPRYPWAAAALVGVAYWLR